MHPWLDDLFGHQEWADAEHWRVMSTRAPALDDEVIRARLHHIHLVQWAFLSVCRGEEPVFARLDSFDDPAALCAYGRSYHEAVRPWLAGLTPRQFDQPVSIPWFEDPPLRLPVSLALTQAAMHSHHHRAQNALRLRELGAEPPTVDFIVWVWKARPAPTWPRLGG